MNMSRPLPLLQCLQCGFQQHGNITDPGEAIMKHWNILRQGDLTVWHLYKKTGMVPVTEIYQTTHTG